MTEHERDQLEGAALLEHSRAKLALEKHVLLVERDVAVFRDVVEAQAQDSLTIKDGQLYNKAESIALQVPEEYTLVRHVQGREDLREKVRALQGQLIRLGLPT